MEPAKLNLLDVKRGSISAPAGCGKTQLIAESLRTHAENKPVLILTHTIAGVAALRARLVRSNVKSSSYSLSTIDGWAMRIVSNFPSRSGIARESLNLANQKVDYIAIRNAAIHLITDGSIQHIICSSYSHVLVDEYQDCTASQHAIVKSLANILPCCVLGDPLQAIFSFGEEKLVDWSEDVCSLFTPYVELSTPWRWKKVGANDLGEWLLSIRSPLLNGQSVDLAAAPKSVTWIQLQNNSTDYMRMLKAAQASPPAKGDTTLIIGDSANSSARHNFTKLLGGACAVEAAELSELIAFARSLDLKSAELLKVVIGFGQSVIVKSNSQMIFKRAISLVGGKARTSASPVEAGAVGLIRAPSYKAVAEFFRKMVSQPNARSHRPMLLNACLAALDLIETNPSLSFYESAIRVREQYRAMGRVMPRRAVGSTLLLKGLEAEQAILLDADKLDAKNLYVAMTRGSKVLTICSRSKILKPRP